MGFWNKLGKIALQAAPYVAAPFTGGATLMATGATQKLGQKWAEHDAKKAIEKGIAPSKFDKYLGMASAGAGLASAFTGGFGGALSGAGKSVGTAAGTGAKLSSIASKAGTGASTAAKAGGWQGQLANVLSGNNKTLGGVVGNVAGIGGGTGKEAQIANVMQQVAGMRNPSGGDPATPQNTPRPAATSTEGVPLPSGAQTRINQNMPNLANSIFAGRNQAIMNQPFRRGYETKTIGPDDAEGNPTVITANTPPIYPNFAPSPPVSDDGSGTGSIFGDQLTPRASARRRRAPVAEEEY